MLIAAPYTNDTRWRDIPDEYNIKYTKTSTTTKLVDFCELFPHKRINVAFIDRDFDYASLEQASKIHDNVAVRIMSGQFNELEILREKKIKFFFDVDALPCYSLSLLDAMLNWGISDIYIYDNLCYHMDTVKKKCDEKNIKTRLILNVIPSISPERNKDYKAPIFCPRDLEEIKSYIDIIEFDCWTDNKYDWHEFNILYKTWIKTGDWTGDLREINRDLDLFFPHDSYRPGLFSRRFNCGRACTLQNNCKHCQLTFELIEALHSKGALVKTKGRK